MQGVGGTKDSAWPAKTMKVLEMFYEMFFMQKQWKLELVYEMFFLQVNWKLEISYLFVCPSSLAQCAWVIFWRAEIKSTKLYASCDVYVAHRRWLHLIKEAVLPAEALFNCIHHRKRKYQFSFHWELRVLIISLNDIRHFLPVKWSGERCQWSFETEICFRRRRI